MYSCDFVKVNYWRKSCFFDGVITIQLDCLWSEQVISKNRKWEGKKKICDLFHHELWMKLKQPEKLLRLRGVRLMEFSMITQRNYSAERRPWNAKNYLRVGFQASGSCSAWRETENGFTKWSFYKGGKLKDERMVGNCGLCHREL